MLAISVRDLKRKGIGDREDVGLVHSAEGIDQLPPLAEPVNIEGSITHLGSQGFLVDLMFRSAYALQCARCLRPVHQAVDVRSEETFAVHGPWPAVEDDVVDIEPMLREALLLEEPLRVLCRPDCAGLCPTCGKDLNEGPCDCGPAPPDPRLSALAKLLPDHQKEES